ncbi:MAG: hypothetical protein U1F53_20165 [Burkholderiaceae bacterium]
MDETDAGQRDAWISTFARRLAARWPHLEEADAEHVGDGLWREAAWRLMEPTLAAELWMAQVMAPTRPPPRAVAESGAAAA